MIYTRADKLNLEFADEWSELKLGQYLNFLDSTNDPESISALTGVDVSILRKSKAYDLSQRVLNKLNYLSNPPKFSAKRAPKTLIVRNTLIRIPRNFSADLNYGQKADIEEAMKDITDRKEKITFQTIARPILSICLYPLITGKEYDMSSDVEEVLDDIDGLPVVEALNLSAFFLRNIFGSRGSGLVYSIPTTALPRTNYQASRLALSKGLLIIATYLRLGRLLNLKE